MLSRILFRTVTSSVFSCTVKCSPGLKSNFSTKILELNNLQTIPGAFKKRRRWGRGVGSGRGKTCGWGHQKSRSTPRGFEGGQTPLYKRLPKIGFHNYTRTDFQVVNLAKIQEFISQGRLIPRPDTPLTIRDLLRSGIISQPGDGVKLLANGKDLIKSAVHLEVSDASKEAINAIEAAGGTVTCVHLNKLAIRAVLNPFKFDILPHRARPPPKIMEKYLDHTKRGYLSPEVQLRNLKLFGQVTSESRYRKEHEVFMAVQRVERQKLKADKLKLKNVTMNSE